MSTKGTSDRQVLKMTPSAGATQAHLNCARIMKDWRGEVVVNAEKGQGVKKGREGTPLALGDFIAGHLALGQSVPKEKRKRAAVLSVRLERGVESGELVALSREDVKLIREVIEALPNLPAYLVGAVQYLTDPDSLTVEERETMAFFDTDPEIPAETSDGDGDAERDESGTSRSPDPESRSA